MEKEIQKNFIALQKAKSYQLKAERGFAAIVSLLAIMSMSVVFASGFLFVTLRGIEGMQAQTNSIQGYYASEAGIEDAIYRIKNNKNIGTETVVTVGSATATTTIATVGQIKTIIAEGALANATRKVQTELELSADETDFHYGVQVGEGGVEMDQNSTITGSIYSNGNVTGSSGARITGDAWIAGGASPTLDAKWEVQNADLAFGAATGGNSVTTVDSTGDTGEYTSIALGSDGFARISYMDNSNDDLKFARCTNADCTSSVRTAVDTAGEGYEVTSLALDANNFGYISYYHDGNDDQKFTRCTNADCSAKNTTIVESSGNVGDTSAIKIGSDGFARIAYFQDDAGDVKFAQCTNADCTAKNITTVDATNYAGEWLSLALGSNGFARISYHDDTNNELKFIRCTNDDCTNKNITLIDTTNDVGKYNSLVLDASNFAQISYYDASGENLKFVRCTNEDCTNKNITTVDSSGDVGQYSSIALGSDGFARISYYDESNTALKFVRCTNADCTTKNISTVDNAASVGKYTSVTLGSDGFARISYFDDSNDDLKFARCIDNDCTPSQQRLDVAQSFQLATSTASAVRRVSLYIKKVGTPSDITVRIMKDEGGRPGDSGSDVLASGTLSASAVTTNYGWVDISFTTNPTLNPGTTYWIMTDTSLDNNNYWVWGLDSAGGYAQGSAKFSDDWDNGVWSNITGDLDFRVWVGGTDTSLDGVVVEGDVHAHSITNSSVCGDAYYQYIDTNSLNFLNAPTTPPCPTPLTNGTAYPGSTDPPLLGMPISQGNIDKWKTDAQAGGTIAGNYTVSSNVSFGPKEITGDLVMTSNNKILIVTGTIYVQGNIDISNGSTIQCDAGYGANSCVIMADGWIHVSNNGAFSGSGTAGSYLMMLTTLACDGTGATSPDGKACGHHDGAVDVHNQATGVIFYATDGMINLHNGVNITEATAYKLRLDNTATITYDVGLSNVNFSSGPSAGWAISGWKEVQ